MKIITSSLTGLGLLGLLAMESRASMQIYDDTQICTMYDSVMNWDMTVHRTKIVSRVVTPPFQGLGVLDVRSLVFGDQSNPEVFGLVRQGGADLGLLTATPTGKRGGYSHLLTRTSDYNLIFDRGPSSSGGSPTADNFYTTPHATNGFAYTSGSAERNFRDTTSKKRASMKIDYVCTTPTSVGYTIWKPLGVWNMYASKTQTLPPPTTEYGVSHGRLIDLSATIQSDPDIYGYIQVDNFEHVTPRTNIPGSNRGRGGILWIGYGCQNGAYGNCGVSGTDYTAQKLRLYAGIDVGPGHKFRQSNYSSTSVPNRGWVKMQYTGPKSTTKKVPYAMKTRVIASNSWDMTYDLYMDIPFSELRLNARRIANISSVILSNPDFGDNTRVVASNFHRPIGQWFPDNLGGGPTYVDEGEGVIRLSMVGQHDNNGYFQYSFYNNSEYNGGGYTTAHVSVDYLAGSCAQGPTGLEVDAIPSGPKRTGDCDGSSQPFILQGAGDSFGNALYDGMDQDAFTLFSKSVGNDGTKTLAVKVESVSGTGGVAGITLRTSDLKKNSPHATVIVDGGGYVQFLTRSATGNSNVQQGTYSSSLPVWLGLRQSGSTLTAYISTASSPDVSQMATTWTQVGNSASLSALLNPESVRVGMVVSNDDYYGDISNAQMRSFTEQN